MKLSHAFKNNFLKTIFTLISVLIFSFSGFADYYKDDDTPKLDHSDTYYRFGNLNFYVDYDLANGNPGYISAGSMAFTFIIHENDGGYGNQDAWLEKGIIKYKIGDGNWKVLATIKREKDIGDNSTSSYTYCTKIDDHDQYGFIKNTNLEWIYRDPGFAYHNIQKAKDKNHECESMRLRLKKIPMEWYGKTVKIRLEGLWEKDGDSQSAKVFQHNDGIAIGIPTVSVNNCNATADANSCNGKIPIKFTTPAELTQLCSSYRTTKSIEITKKFKIKYRKINATTYSDIVDTNLGPKDNHGWYTYTANNNMITTSLTNGGAGEEYEFLVIFKYMPVASNHTYYFSVETPIFNGSTMPPPPPPVIDSIVPGCGEATVHFSVLDGDVSNIDHYYLNRKYSNIPSEIIASNIDKNAKSHTFTQEANTNFWLLVVAVNSCDAKSYSAYKYGKAHSAPQFDPITTSATQKQNGALIEWEHSMAEPTMGYSTFQVYRKIEGEIEYILIADNISSGIREYLDADAVMCNNNLYVVKLFNHCGETASDPISVEMFTDFGDVINPEKVSASTGYFNNKIEINWEYYPGFKETVTGLKIFRKQPNEGNFVQVKYIADNQTVLWNDMEAEANQLYQYQLVAAGECNGEQASDTIDVVGFRLKTGIVTGNISFEGGNPVEGVEVKISEGTSPTSSLAFVKTNNNYLLLKDSTLLTNRNEFTVEMWVYSEQWKSISTSQVLVANRDFRLLLNNGTVQLKKFKSDGLAVDFNLYAGNYLAHIDDLKSWHHVATSFAADSVKIYFDGEILGKFRNRDPGNYPFTSLNTFIATRPNTPPNIDAYKANDILTASILQDFNGNLDEVRIWDHARTEKELARDYKRIIIGDELGLITYLRFDEGFGDMVYDRSKTGDIFNKNNGEIYGATWTSFSPGYEKLHSSGISDQYGNYVVGGIPFSGTGEIFTVTPEKGVHVFSPSQKPLFIGDNQLVHNDVDFIDKSSFEVPIKIMYTNAEYYPVADVYIKIDGKYVIGNDNTPLKTDTHGEVTIDVPIGNHNISVEKNGHVFENSFWPPKNNGVVIKHYFEEDFAEAINFEDVTTVKLVGKIVGGSVEKDKPIGSNINPTKNNIGTAQITIGLSNEAYELHPGKTDTLVFTNTETGIYEVHLIPEKFIISSAETNDHQFITQNTGSTIIDLNNKFYLFSTIDTLDTGALDTALTYNHQQDFILRNPPTFGITNNNGEAIFGDQFFTIDETDIPLYTTEQGAVNYTFGLPVFKMDQSYTLDLSAYEQYENNDNPVSVVIDRVPVSDGTFIINNDISGIDVELDSDDNGNAELNFSGGFPKISSPYTVQLNAQLKIGDNFYSHNVPSSPIEGYILGTTPTGNNFVTSGPDQLKYILRDPYGSGSSAELSQGTTISNAFTQTVTAATNLTTDFTTSTGFNMWVAAGMPPLMKITTANTEAKNTLTLETNSSLTESTTCTSSITLNSSLSTSSSPSYVGANGDIFYGLATNIIFGENRDICITKEQQPSNSEIKIDSLKVGNEWYYLKRKNKIGLGSQFSTEFIYTQKHIENDLIPNLLKIRDDLLSNNPKYESIIENTEDPNYGLSNDNPVFSDTTLYIDTLNDPKRYYGESYYYYPDTLNFTNADGESVSFDDLHKDSVHYMNTQIDLWKHYLALNEEQKLAAELDENHKNISFDAGSTYSSSITTSETKSITGTFNFYIGVNFAIKTGIAIDGTGIKVGVKNEISINTNISDTHTTSESTTIGFTLADSDLHNYYSIDVKKCMSGYGPVFFTKGGQSSCLYQGEERTKYFEPGDHILSNATVQIEVPRLTVNTNNISGVQDDEPAYFELYLSNESEAGVATWYTLITDNSTNPNNAELFMDGAALSTGLDIKVPADGTITKTIEFHKGVPDIFNYENIRVLMKSRCDYTIWKEEFLTVNFKPTCSDVDITNLANEWIMNLSNNDILDVEIGDYNRNNVNLEKISFQYKRPGELIPKTMMNFFNDSSQYNNSSDQEKTMLEDISTTYPAEFKTGEISDGIYDIRAIASCNNGVETFYTESPYLRGTIDRLAPHLFGLPQPADGVLSPNDEIQVKFNETINEGFLYMRNDLITVRGIKNGTDLSASEYILHNACVSFDGQNQHLLIPQGVNLKYSSFTIEFWAQRKQTGKECLFYQSNPGNNGLWIGFDENDKFTAVFNTDTIKTDIAFDNIQDQWCHFAVVYDVNEDVDNLLLSVLYDAGNEIKIKTASSHYFETNPVYIGNTGILNNGFNGEMHGLRIWNNALSTGDLVANKSTILTGYETGLIGYWPLDDAHGDKAKDLAFARHANMNATWQVTKKGKALNLTNNNYFSFNTGGMIFSNQTNFTIEFWFKGDVPSGDAYLFGNGLADGTDGFESAWAIIADNSENIIIRNNGADFSFPGTGFFDNNWHHLAVTVNRRGSINGYIDGELKYTNSANGTTALGGANCYMGVSYDALSGGGVFGNFFAGGIDEVRVWNSALPISIINQNLHTTLSGDEPGLKAYFPFEDVNETNPLVLNSSLDNFSQSNYLNAGDGAVTNDEVISTVTPMLKLSPPKASIDFTYSINNDEVIITPMEDASAIENINLEISIRRVKDMFGNEMASTEIWNAFMDKNQLVWDKQSIALEKDNESELTFKMLIHNKGGQVEQFNILNIPSWLEVNTTTGYIDPLQSKEITFTVNSALNTGSYITDVYLNGSMNFNERLSINLSVIAKEPDWIANPEGFENSMIVIGKIKIGDNFSTDIKDKVGAFINDECRGVAWLQYFPDYDIYLLNLTIHGNINDGTIEFKIWDASEGFVYGNVTPVIDFNHETVEGTPDNPVIIFSRGEIAGEIALNENWNWVSFNLNSSKLNDINQLIDHTMATKCTIVKSLSDYAQGSTSGTMTGGLQDFDYSNLYMFNMSEDWTLDYTGLPVVTSSSEIEIYPGWNWIGYTPQLKIALSEALSYFTPENEDVIKGQYQFAMYNNMMGWIGSLEHLTPGKGYKYSSNSLNTFSFIYPREPILKSDLIEKSSLPPFNIQANKWRDNMSIVGIFKTVNGEVINDLALVADNLDEPRGFASPINVNKNDLLFLTVYGEQNEELKFSAMSLTDDQIIPLENKMIFASDAINGTIENPVVFTILNDDLQKLSGSNGATTVQCYPNPFSEEINIELTGINRNDIAIISIYSMDGKLQRKIETTDTRYQWDGNNQEGYQLPNGIYNINVIIGEFTHNQRVVKRD